MRNINLAVFGIAFLLFLILSAVSFYGGYGYDEGSRDTSAVLLYNIFKLLHFPLQIAFSWKIVTSNESLATITFFLGVLLDITIYALLTERLVYHLTKWKDQK